MTSGSTASSRYPAMRWISVIACAGMLAGADALAPTPLRAAESPANCLSIASQVLGVSGPRRLYRIVFTNGCEAPRVVAWCAEHPSATVPDTIACPKSVAGEAPAPGAFLVARRREFQWTLPAGSRLRHVACPQGELPTLGYQCMPLKAR